MPVKATATYRGEPHQITWPGVSTDGQQVVEIRPTGRRSGASQTVPAREVDCPHGYRLTDSCPCCP